MASQPNVNYHLGHMIIEGFRKNGSDICQIDAATGEKETHESVLKRAISLARSLRTFGLRPGDVITLSGRNHLDLRIPYCAALMIGCPIAGVDPSFKYIEIKRMFKILEPKLSFCQRDSLESTAAAVNELGLHTKIITFEDDYQEFIETYSEDDGEDFQPTDFDPKTTFAWLLSTSGSTGMPKVAAFYHEFLVKATQGYLRTHKSDAAKGVWLNLSPVQWTSGYLTSLFMPIIGTAIVQTSAPATIEHVIDIINEYKPTSTMLSPVMANLIIRNENPCDLTCFRQLSLTGSKVHNQLLLELRARCGKDCVVVEVYGQSECLTPVFDAKPDAPLGSCGRMFPWAKAKLVDIETREEIKEPGKPGELLVVPSFAEYYNMPEETKEAITPDGWFKTGDILYRDDTNYYYYVERIKMMIKYKGHQILPIELEEVIRAHPSVHEVCVTSVPDQQCGEKPVACVVRKAGHEVSAVEIKDLVAGQLSESKALRGGVVFLDELPLTSTGKIAKAKLKELVLRMSRE